MRSLVLLKKFRENECPGSVQDALWDLFTTRGDATIWLLWIYLYLGSVV